MDSSALQTEWCGTVGTQLIQFAIEKWKGKGETEEKKANWMENERTNLESNGSNLKYSKIWFPIYLSVPTSGRLHSAHTPT